MASNTQYEKLKKKTLAKAQQNRKNRVERSNKQYGNKTSKSQQAYIAGDVLSSASMKAYAYKKDPSYMPKQSFITGGRSKSNYAKLQNGENPYEAKYVYTGKPTVVKGGTRADGSKYDSFVSKKRMLTDDEKKMWEAQGSLDKKKYDQNYKYHWFDNYNKDAKTFKEHSNLTQDGKMLWDGMKVAKNRVANGGSKWNYLGGFLKDTLIDGGIEAIRHLDRISSAGTGAVAGLLEESANLIKGDVDWNRPVKNIKESLEQSEKTGWGKGLSEFFDDATKRNSEKDIAHYKEMQKGLSKNSDAYKHYDSLIKNAENNVTDGKHKAFRSITGFVGDILNPIEVGDGLVNGLKGATKLATKSGKELLSGTADLSTAFKSKDELSKIAFEHQDMLNRMSAYKKYLQEEYMPHLKKAGKKFDDVEAERLFEDSSYAREYAERSGNLANNIDQRINHSLDKGYSNAMANDTKQIVNEVKSNPGTEKLGEFLDEMDSITKDNETYSKTFKGFYNTKNKGELDIDGLFEMLDNIDDDFSYGMLDWLEQNKPSVYKKYMGDIDNIDDMADIGITPKIDIPSDVIEKPKKESETLRKYNESIDNYIKQEIETSGNSKNVLNDAYNKMNIDRMMQESTASVSENLPYSINKQKFLNGTKDFTNKLNTMDQSELEELSSVLRTLEDIPDAIKRDEVVKAMNDVLFGGEKVIRNSITPKDLRNLILHCDDLISYKLTELTGGFSFKPRGSNNTKNGTHYMRDRNGKNNVFKSNFNMYAPTSTDELFEEKMSLVDSLVGIKHKGELSKPIEELKKLRRSLLENGEDLSEKDFMKLADLENRLKIRQQAYDNVKNLDYDDYQKYIQKHYGKEDVVKSELDKLASKQEKLTIDDFYNESVEEVQKLMESGKLDKFLQEGGNPEDFVEDIMQVKYQDYLNERSSYKNRVDHNQRNIDIKKDGNISQSPRMEQESLNEVGELEFLSQDEMLSNNIKKLREQLGVAKPTINKRKIKLAKGQKLGSLPPVVENSKNLRKVIESELEMMYKNPKEYDTMKDAFKRIKKEYVQSMRSFGVRDEQYFKKVKQVQDDLKTYYEELSKPKKKTPLDSVGQGTPKLGMNLQLLAKRISDTFDEMDNLIFGDDLQQIDKPIVKQMVEQIDEQMVKQMDEPMIKPELGKIYDEVPDNFNPFSMFDKDEVPKVVEKKPKIRRKRTQEELDEINATLKRFEDVPSVEKYNVSKGEMPKTTLEQPKFDQFKEWFNDKEMPYDENVLYDTYKRWLNSWKKGLTVYNPGWHVQNYFQNKGQNYLALGDKAFGSQKKARNVLKEIKGEVGNGDMILTKNGKVYSQKDMADLAKRYDVVEGQADNIIESRGIFAPLETKVDNSWIMNKLSESEETARLHHFITQIERGMSPEEASKSVNKYLYDYSKQNKADRLMSDFVDPFWTFHKNNARLMTSQAIENPQRIAKINRGIRGLQDDVEGEDKASQQYRSIQSPIGAFKDEVNEDTYNYQYDMNLFPSYEGAIPLEKDDVDSKLNPLVKIAQQQMEGVGNFGNKITDKEISGYNEITKDERALEILKEINPFMNPLVKALNNSKRHQEKADEEKQSQKASNKQILATWLEYIFGNKGNYYRDVR